MSILKDPGPGQQECHIDKSEHSRLKPNWPQVISQINAPEIKQYVNRCWLV